MIYDKDSNGNLITLIQVKEEWTQTGQVATGGNYQAQSFEIVVDHAIDTWKSETFSWPYPISIFSTEWINETVFKGDEVRVQLAPDTITGAITADVAIGDTEINVSSTVTDNVQRGYLLEITNFSVFNAMGRVVDYDGAAGTVTMETATTDAFLAATPTYIRQTVDFIPRIMLRSGNSVELAKDVVGGSYLPANTPLVVSYKNVQGDTTNKTFSFIMEYKY